MSAHQRLRWFRRGWRLQQTVEDARPYYEVSIIFQAADMDEADRLFDAMCEATGCNDATCGADKPCPHFRVGGLHRVDEDD